MFFLKIKTKENITNVKKNEKDDSNIKVSEENKDIKNMVKT